MASYHFRLLKCISTEHEYAEYSDRVYINCTKKNCWKMYFRIPADYVGPKTNPEQAVEVIRTVFGNLLIRSIC